MSRKEGAAIAGNGEVRRFLRVVRSCKTTGIPEARRRWQEHREDLRIGEELRRGPVLTEEERRAQSREMFRRPYRFTVFPLPGGEKSDRLERSLREQTFADFSLGAPGDTLPSGPEAYAVFAEEDAFLHPGALHACARALEETEGELVYTDEDFFTGEPRGLVQPHCKPDFGEVTLQGCNLLGPLLIARCDLLRRAGLQRPERDFAALDADARWDATLALAGEARGVVHVPRILYYRPAPEGRIPQPALRRQSAQVEGRPLVSILIPNKDHREDLLRCVNAIREKSTWPNWEILVLENNSTEEETFRCYEELKRDARVRVAVWEGPFNYSAINNFGFRQARGEQVLLLNNDTEVLTPGWLEEMLCLAQRPDAGAVGAKLYYPDGTIQHAGIGLGIKMLAGHYHRGFAGDSPGYFGRLACVQNLTAVTAACMMIPRRVYEAMNGLDENYSVVFNDVDLCLRMRQAGLGVFWTPFAELTHYESLSRGADEDTPEKKAFFVRETNRFLRRWTGVLAAGDPFYNRNLTRWKEDFSLRL